MIAKLVRKARTALSVLAGGATVATAAALGTAAPASADVVVVSITIQVVEQSPQPAYVLSMNDACRLRYGHNDVYGSGRNCHLWDGRTEYLDPVYINTGARYIDHDRIYCPGNFRDHRRDNVQFVGNWQGPTQVPQYVYQGGNQQFGGTPPPVNMPDAPPLPAPVYDGYYGY